MIGCNNSTTLVIRYVPCSSSHLTNLESIPHKDSPRIMIPPSSHRPSPCTCHVAGDFHPGPPNTLPTVRGSRNKRIVQNDKSCDYGMGEGGNVICNCNAVTWKGQKEGEGEGK